MRDCGFKGDFMGEGHLVSASFRGERKTERLFFGASVKYIDRK